MNRAFVVLLAAGEGERLGRGPKAFLEIGGRSLLAIAVERAAACPGVEGLVVAVPGGLEDRASGMVRTSKSVSAVAGGAHRQDSVRVALQAVPEAAEVVVCHDAARPFAQPELFTAVIEALSDAEGVVPALTPPDTVKRVRDGFVEATLDRDALRLTQTPQAFVAPALREAHHRAHAEGVRWTDDAGLMEWAGFRVRVVPGDPGNFKITSPEDLARAERLLLELPPVGV